MSSSLREMFLTRSHFRIVRCCYWRLSLSHHASVSIYLPLRHVSHSTKRLSDWHPPASLILLRDIIQGVIIRFWLWDTLPFGDLTSSALTLSCVGLDAQFCVSKMAFRVIRISPDRSFQSIQVVVRGTCLLLLWVLSSSLDTIAAVQTVPFAPSISVAALVFCINPNGEASSSISVCLRKHLDFKLELLESSLTQPLLRCSGHFGVAKGMLDLIVPSVPMPSGFLTASWQNVSTV